MGNGETGGIGGCSGAPGGVSGGGGGAGGASGGTGGVAGGPGGVRGGPHSLPLPSSHRVEPHPMHRSPPAFTTTLAPPVTSTSPAVHWPLVVTATLLPMPSIVTRVAVYTEPPTHEPASRHTPVSPAHVTTCMSSHGAEGGKPSGARGGGISGGVIGGVVGGS
jgi:hypothetical protein